MQSLRHYKDVSEGHPVFLELFCRGEGVGGVLHSHSSGQQGTFSMARFPLDGCISLFRPPHLTILSILSKRIPTPVTQLRFLYHVSLRAVSSQQIPHLFFFSFLFFLEICYIFLIFTELILVMSPSFPHSSHNGNPPV